jgi:hypothetical protein
VTRACLALSICSTLWIWQPATARATQPSDFACEPEPSPPPSDSQVPENPLLFGFAVDSLTDSNGAPVATAPAPAPWDLDARYRVPAKPLNANATYTMSFVLGPSTSAGQFQTLAAIDTQAPSAPSVLWFGGAANANTFSFCATDRTELFGLGPSSDDLSAQSDLRYDLSQVLSDGGLAMVYNELMPFGLPDGGLVLAVQYGLQGMPGDWVAQARDLAGNLSAPSGVQHVDIGTGCTFASSTTGRGESSLLLALLGLVALRRRTRAR